MRPPRRLGAPRSGCVCLCHLQTVQVVDGALRVSGSGEDRTPILTQDFEPMREVRSMILARFRGDAKISTKEGRTQLGHQFLARVCVIPKAFASEFPVEAALVFRPVAFMPMSA